MQAQLFSRHNLAVSQGMMTFHNPSLNNQSNTNKKVSWVTELDKHLYITRFASLNTGIGLGNYKSLDTLFKPYQSSNFFRIKAGLVLHPSQHFSYRNLSPKRFNPFIKVAYNVDVLDKNYESTQGHRIAGNLRLGVGFVIKLNHYAGLTYEFSHNQRVSPDYRSFFQHNFGLILNLDPPMKPY